MVAPLLIPLVAGGIAAATGLIGGGATAAAGAGVGSSRYKEGYSWDDPNSDRIFKPEAYDWGGNPEQAQNVAAYGQGMSDSWNQAAGKALGRSMGAEFNTGAVENQVLSDREAHSRGYDQSGALQLQREAAMGMAPSAAAWQMQRGLDQSLANQSAMAGGARGAAGIAMAQGNAGANMTNLQQKAFTEAGALRANEMANARQGYSQLSSQMRDQDQNRLAMGNQMAQFNSKQFQDWQQGWGQQAAQMGQLGLGNYQAAMRPYDSQAQQRYNYDHLMGDMYNRVEDRASGVQTTNANARQQEVNNWMGLFGTLTNLGGNAMGKGLGGK